MTRTLDLDLREALATFWMLTQPARAELGEELERLGLPGLELPTLDPRLLRSPAGGQEGPGEAWVERGREAELARELCRGMGALDSAEHEGFYTFDIARALDNEAALREALRELGGAARVRQLFALKAKHCPLFLHARRLADPEAGVEIASLPELLLARSVGYPGSSLLMFNPAIRARELYVAYRLGVRDFVVDHPAKLARILEACARFELDPSELRILLRLSARYGSPSLKMARFGLDPFDSPRAVRELLERCRAAGIGLAGLAFHVGMGARSEQGYLAVFEAAARVFELCVELGVAPPRILDVGGGFAADEGGQRFGGALPIDEQLEAIGRGLRELQARFGVELELWSESGQGIVGNAGAVYLPVDFHEQRQLPARAVEVVAPSLPGSLLWFQRSKRVFATREQWLSSRAGWWSLGVARYCSVQPELWMVEEASGEVGPVEVPAHARVPTLLFGRSCDPLDALNPRVEGQLLRVLMPELAALAGPGRRFVLRVPFGAYTDNCGDFNGQTLRELPRRCVLDEAPAPARAEHFPRRAFARGLARRGEDCVYRDRVLEHGVVSAAQIEQVKDLIAERFSTREQMTQWLRETGQLSADELEAMRLRLREHAADCVDSGLSMVRLRVPAGAPDHEGEVCAVVTCKRLRAQDIAPLPDAAPHIYERRRARLPFEIETRILRRLVRLDGSLREKLLPTAYIAMSARGRGPGPSVTSLRRRVVELARAAAGIKSVISLTTGARSSEVAARMPGDYVALRVPYAGVEFHGERPFAGVRFGDEPGELRLHVVELRGPAAADEAIPRERLERLELGDRSWVG